MRRECTEYEKQQIVTNGKRSYIVLKALKPSNCVVEFYLCNGYSIFYEDDAADEVLKPYLPLKYWDVLMFKKCNAKREKYYRCRANEYERIYQKPERLKYILEYKKYLKKVFYGKAVLELVCCTDFWTEAMSETAASILAAA